VFRKYLVYSSVLSIGLFPFLSTLAKPLSPRTSVPVVIIDKVYMLVVVAGTNAGFYDDIDNL
jgi:hypothetical protein